MVIRWWRRGVRAGFRLLYNELAWTYDGVSWLVSLGEWRAWQAAGLAFLPASSPTPPRILELAHGPGHMLVALRRVGFAPVGVDLSPFMGRLARQRLRRAGLPSPLIRASALALPFADHSFDHILATFPTDFITQREASTQLWRLLRPGGRLVIVPQAQFRGRGVLVRLLACLYAITGQRLAVTSAAVSPWLALEAAGFRVREEHVSLPRSVVLVVVAEKFPYN
ncbi:MAG: methyltransferase domain-containing protein [Ardenticatenales bacterium]|nr:methyltransferase domain-containing protein [Ardenticatenales bacterium]